MDAPTYPPSAAYEAPVRAPRLLSTRDTAIADLQAVPAAWAIVTAELPGVDARVGSERLKPHLGSMSFRSLAQFGVVRNEQLDRIDERLRALGAVQ